MNTSTPFKLISIALCLMMSLSCNNLNEANQDIKIKKASIGWTKTKVIKPVNKNIVCFYDIDLENFGLEWTAQKITATDDSPIIAAIEAYLDHHHFGEQFKTISFQNVQLKDGINHYYFSGKTAEYDTQFQNFVSALQMTIDRLDISKDNRLFFR